MNYLWFFTKERKYRYADFADADLVSYLRFQCFCLPRTLNLIQSLRIKCIRFFSEFDMSSYSMQQLYDIMSASIAACLLPSAAEERLVDSLKTSSLHLAKYQKFFLEGQYHAPGWFSRGESLGPRE